MKKYSASNYSTEKYYRVVLWYDKFDIKYLESDNTKDKRLGVTNQLCKKKFII